MDKFRNTRMWNVCTDPKINAHLFGLPIRLPRSGRRARYLNLC